VEKTGGLVAAKDVFRVNPAGEKGKRAKEKKRRGKGNH